MFNRNYSGRAFMQNVNTGKDIGPLNSTPKVSFTAHGKTH